MAFYRSSDSARAPMASGANIATAASQIRRDQSVGAQRAQLQVLPASSRSSPGRGQALREGSLVEAGGSVRMPDEPTRIRHLIA